MTGTWWSERDGGITVAVRVTPVARASEVVAEDGDRLRVRIAAPAVEGKANAELQRLLATRFGVRPRAVTLVRGEHSRDKVVHIEGITTPP
jgi:uncharacterized protein (TIGR00251 family)